MKKTIRLYIQANEDHVHLQEGAIAMLILVTVYKEKNNSKLIGKKKLRYPYYSKT